VDETSKTTSTNDIVTCRHVAGQRPRNKQLDNCPLRFLCDPCRGAIGRIVSESLRKLRELLWLRPCELLLLEAAS
jgi:hypothetical protein